MGNNGQGNLPKGVLPLLKATLDMPCYVCGNPQKVPKEIAAKVKYVVCPQCEQDKNMFLLNLYKQSRTLAIAAQEKARQQSNEQNKQEPQG